MPTEDVNNVSNWFQKCNRASRKCSRAHSSSCNQNCPTGLHVDNRPPTEVVASSLRGSKLWLFATHGSTSAAILVKRPEETHLEQFMEDMVYGRYKDLLYCQQEPGDTICSLARTAQFVLSVTPDYDWHCLLSHNVLHQDEQAAALESRALNRCCGQRSRNVQRKRPKRSGVSRKRFTPRRRTKTS